MDVVFLDFFAKDVVAALRSLGWGGSMGDVELYMPRSFTSSTYLPLYVKQYWQENMPSCPGGLGVGYDD